MRSFLAAGGGPGDGLFLGKTEVRCRFTEVAAKGDLVQFDLANIATGLSADGGAPGTSKLNTVRIPDASATSVANTQCYIYGIASEAVAAGADGPVLVRGKFTGANVVTCVDGSALIPVTTGRMGIANVGAPTGAKILGIALGADVSNAADVIFNGVEGLGFDA